MILIKNAKLSNENVRDILIRDDKIYKIDNKINQKDDYKVLDAKGSFVLAGIVDLNVRLANDTLNKNSLKKLTKTSLRGGVTTCVIMPDFTPRLDNSTLLEHFNIKAKNEEVSLYVAAPLVDKSNEKLNNIATFLDNGASVIWTNSNINANLLKRGFEYARMKLVPIFCRCYEPNLDESGVMNEGELSFKLGLSGISKISESSEVAKIAEISTMNNTKIIFQALSTKRSIDIIKDMKKANKNIYSEVSVHHLIKNEESCNGFNTYAKIFPPLRDEDERDKILNEIENIDILTSAHSAKSVLYKDVAFEEASFGLGCIEEYLSLCYTFLVNSGLITMKRLEELIATKPAELLSREKIGKIEEGYSADIVIFDENESYIVSDKASLYYNEKLFGKVKKVIKNGYEVEI